MDKVTPDLRKELDKEEVAMDRRLSTNEYWNDLWKNVDVDGEYIFDRKDAPYALNHYVHLLLKEYFGRYLEDESIDFIEIGCGASKFLPYINKEFGFHVYGLDYSDVGCETARYILEKSGVEGTIIEGDMFEKADEYAERFDVVYSGGVIEHFEDTTYLAKTISKYARGGGNYCDDSSQHLEKIASHVDPEICWKRGL